jgi:GT2 family glycosyltransferase
MKAGKSMQKSCVVIPNWNGADSLPSCLDSLLGQSLKAHIIVVDNGSVDESLKLLEKYPQVEVIKHTENKGFAGGVNSGIRQALEMKASYVALLNNDAVADKNWLEELVAYMDSHDDVGIVTSKILDSTGKKLDSTGDYYTIWGLPYPRGRGESDIDKYDGDVKIFGASGGASLYRVSMLQEIGLFDEDFFAYYEDVDLSFRAQLAGWKVAYVPNAVAYHQIGGTSNKLKGFTTYQTMKNQPLLLLKNVPRRYLFRIGWRFTLAHTLFFLRSFSRREGWAALKGDLKGTKLLFSAYNKRRRIQRSKKVPDEYIWSILVHDLPPNAHSLRKLRTAWQKIFRK